MSRPTKYKEEYNEQVNEYLELCQDEEVSLLESVNTKTGRERFASKLKVNLPTIEGFARYLGVNKTSLYEWAKVYEEFSNSLERIKTEQATRLQNMGLSGEYNSTIAKLILSSNHGMRERSDITSDDEPIFDEHTRNKAREAIGAFLAGGDTEPRTEEGG